MIPRLRRLRALILHRTSVREKDRVVEVFSREEGRLKLLAAGVSRFPSRRAGHLEPLLEAEITVSASSRGDSIRDARTLAAFPRLRSELPRLRLAYVIARLLREGTGEHLADAPLYDAMRALFDALDDDHVPPSPLILLSAELRMLHHLGALPDPYRCVRCQRKLVADAFSFDRRTRAFFCAACAPANKQPDLTDAVKLYRLLLAHPAPPAKVHASAAAVKELRAIIGALFQPLRAQIGIRLGTRC